jgi:uncharacterized protein (DUF2267 family)
MPPPQPLERNIPILTDVIRTAVNPLPADIETLLAEVQTKLASRTFQLADDLLRSAFAEMEATLFEQISSRLRSQLPDLIDATLREHFDTHNDG